MRILHLDSGREMRGGQWQSLRLHEGLLARGHESILLRRGEMNPWNISRRYDLVHAHDARSHTLAALFARSPLVVSRRVAFPIRSRWKYNRVNLFIAVSNHVADILRKHGIDENRIVTVCDGVPLPEKVSEGGDTILALPNKGAERAGVEVQVSTELEADLKKAKALIYLSDCEGLGSAILLAMAHGVPVIASDLPAIREIIEDGVNGVLVRADVSEAIHRLTPQMRKEARKTIEQRFTVDQMVNQTMAAYRRIVVGQACQPARNIR